MREKKWQQEIVRIQVAIDDTWVLIENREKALPLSERDADAELDKLEAKRRQYERELKRAKSYENSAGVDVYWLSKTPEEAEATRAQTAAEWSNYCSRLEF